jgi:hypothetical protein
LPLKLHSQAFAYPTFTHAFSWAGGINVCVRFAEGVAVVALGFLCVLGGWSFIAEDIYPHRYRLKVAGVYAGFVPAQVVNGKPLRNRPDRKFIGVAVRSYANGGALFDNEPAVPPAQCASPNPAITLRFINVSPEPLLSAAESGGCRRVAVSLPPHVVCAAIATPDSSLFALGYNAILNWSRHIHSLYLPEPTESSSTVPTSITEST